MIDAYSWPTPNGHKVHIMLEEVGLPYVLHPVDIRSGEQFSDGFTAISPNSKIPAIVDQQGPGGRPIAIFESGAILIYLAEKAGMLIPRDTAARYSVLQWLMFQMSAIGPMFGQAMHFHNYAPEPVPYAIGRYTKETERLYRVLDRRLSEAEYLAGEYSIADIAVYPWAKFYKRFGANPESLPHFMRWLNAVKERPAVIRGMEALKEHRLKPEQLSAKAKELLFVNLGV